jgi:hypothetical protein
MNIQIFKKTEMTKEKRMGGFQMIFFICTMRGAASNTNQMLIIHSCSKLKLSFCPDPNKLLVAVALQLLELNPNCFRRLLD